MPPASSASRSRRDSSRWARVCRISPLGIGGIATQALVNPYYGIDGVRLLREGRAPRDVVETLIAADAGHASRQLHIMDASGRIAAYTGADCVDWCGHIEGNGFSIAGNMLAGAARAGRYRESLSRQRKPAVRATPDRGDAIGRGRGRRQARQAIGRASDLRRGGMVRSRPARRRPRRSSRRTGTPGSGQPRALGAFPKISAEPQRIRPGSPTAAIIDAGIEAAIAGEQ